MSHQRRALHPRRATGMPREVRLGLRAAAHRQTVMIRGGAAPGAGPAGAEAAEGWVAAPASMRASTATR